MKYSVYAILFMVTASCGKRDRVHIDPIVGKWHLKAIKDSVFRPLDSCMQRSTIEATTDNKLLDTTHAYDAAIRACKVYGNGYDKWYAAGAGAYRVKVGSISNQQQRITLSGDTLIYYYEAWNNPLSTNGPFTVTPTWKYYLR